MLQDALIISLDNIINSWVLESRVSFHVTPHRKLFLGYVQDGFGQVYLGDDKPYNFFRKGKMLIKLPNKNQWF